jgi:hypothetical protein
MSLCHEVDGLSIDTRPPWMYEIGKYEEYTQL